MAWLKIQSGISTNKKIARLSELRKWGKFETIGFMVSFWIWAAENFDSGEIGDLSDSEIGFILGLKEPVKIIADLQSAGFLDDDKKIHEWGIHQKEFLRSKYQYEPERFKEILLLYNGIKKDFKVIKKELKGNTIEKRREEKRREDREEKKETTTATAPDAESECKKPVNWENCHTDLQRLVAHYVAAEMPELFASATQAQAAGIFKRYGRAASEILAVAGNLETAKAAFDKSRACFNSKNLSWNLSTIAKNIGEFTNSVMEEKINGNRK